MNKSRFGLAVFVSATILPVAFGQIPKSHKRSTQATPTVTRPQSADPDYFPKCDPKYVQATTVVTKPQLADLTPTENQVFPVGVENSLQLDPATQAIYNQMASTLTGYANVPADRTNYYSSVVNQPGYTVNGWGGVVSNVQPNCFGNLVTVQVFVNVSSDAFGPATIVLSSYYFEQFQVNNDGSIQFVGSLDPNGTAGQQLDMCGL